ncbi:78_t:CDS:2, partial [Funneliformis caledonium]
EVESERAVREAFHNSLKVLLDPILTLNNNGVDLTIHDETFWFFPRISVVISDWPEASMFCLT